MPLTTVILIGIIIGLVIALIVVINWYAGTKAKLVEKMQQIQESADSRVRNAELDKEMEIKRIREETNSTIAATLQEADRRVRRIEEQIESQKNENMQKSEKELLAEIIGYVDRYASRLDRIENRISGLNGRMGELAIDVERAFKVKKEQSTSVSTSNCIIAYEVFDDIVQKVIRSETNRVNAYTNDNIEVHATVESITGASEWYFTLYFGVDSASSVYYTYNTENQSSSLPTVIGDAIKKEILFYLN